LRVVAVHNLPRRSPDHGWVSGPAIVHNVQRTPAARSDDRTQTIGHGGCMLQRGKNGFAWARCTTVILSGVFGVSLFLAIAAQPVHSQTYRVIHNFTAKGKDGATPYAGPIFDAGGNLLGTTYLGGGFGGGAVYKLTQNGMSWTYSTLYSLKNIPDGAGPAFG